MKSILSKSRKGSSLVMVVIIFAVAVVLIAALTAYVLSANTVSVQNEKSQQAYFTARSAVSAACAKLLDTTDPSFAAYVAGLADNRDYTSARGTIAGGGDYTVTLHKSGSNLKITGTGYYPKYSSSGGSYATGTVSANLSTGLNPLSNLIYVSNAAGSSINPAQCYGNILFNGSLTISNGSMVDGNVYVSGNLTVSGGARIGQNAYVGGNLSMAGDHIAGSAFCAGNVSFSGPSNQIRGGLTYKGTATTGWGQLSNFVSSANYSPGLILSLPLAAGSVDTGLPTAAAAATRSNLINFTHSTALINRSGTIVSCDGYADNNAPVLIDTRAGDIYFLVSRSISLQNRQFYVTGPNHLYIYLEGNGTALSLGGGSPVIRMQDASQNSTIFVIGGSGTSLELHSAQLQGYVYLPDGGVSIDGGVSNNGAQTGYAIVGSMAVKTANISSNIRLLYNTPNLDGTPLSSLNQYGKPQPVNPDGPNKYPAPGWKITSWSK